MADPNPAPRKRPVRRESGEASRRIVVLSRNPALYSTRRLAEAAHAQGHRLDVVDTLACSVVVDNRKPTVLVDGRELGQVDVVIPRIGASITAYGLAVVRQFELMGVPVLNGSHAIAASRDKLRCLQVLAAQGIAVPRTVMARQRAVLRGAIKRVGGLPAIVKLTQGTQGIGVMIAHSMAEIGSLLDTMWDLGRELILQEFIEESRGRDVRVLVVGDRAVGAMRRTARSGEFRSNLHRGGEGKPFDLTPEYARCAVRAAQAVGLHVAGVDLLEATAGPKVMEVNSSPGFEGLDKALRVDAAALIVRQAVLLAETSASRRGTPLP